MTLRLPATVLRSSGECPCTSALGLWTRRNSAGNSNTSPVSNAIARAALCLRSLNSVGLAVLAFGAVSVLLSFDLFGAARRSGARRGARAAPRVCLRWGGGLGRGRGLCLHRGGRQARAPGSAPQVLPVAPPSTILLIAYL